MKEASCFQGRVLMADLRYPNICKVPAIQEGLEPIDNIFLTRVTEESVR